MLFRGLSVVAVVLIAGCGGSPAAVVDNETIPNDPPLTLSGAPCEEPDFGAWCDTSLAANTRADLLLAEMTQDEKLLLLAGNAGDGEAEGFSPGIERLRIPDAEFSDGPPGVTHDVATGVPQHANLAATFDPAAATEYANIVASDLLAYGLNGWLAPSFDFLRNPLYDRAADSMGESPALMRTMIVASIIEAQRLGVMCVTKHYLAYTEELGRFGSQVNIDERVLRELYLPPVEGAIFEADTDALMVSYNFVNGERMMESEYWNRDVLVGEYGFRGFTMSDFVGILDGAASLSAGVNLEMPTAAHYEPNAVQGYLANGSVTQADVDDAVGRILYAMFKRGLFERPDPEPQPIPYADRTPRARALAAQGIVLLKNDNLLPLDASAVTRIAVIGAAADEINIGGRAGSWPYGVTTRQGLQAVADSAGFELVYNDGSNAANAATLAASADVAIVVVADSGDGDRADRTCMTLSEPCTTGRGNQDALITAVAGAQPNSLVILNVAGPVLTPWRDETAAAIWAGRPGMEAGNALADIVFGAAEAGGRLPFTLPLAETDSPTNPTTQPSRYPGGNFTEGVLVGFRHYDAAGFDVAYPFGHGLGYADISLSNMQITSGANNTASVSVTVSNHGSRAGSEVVQVYVGLPDDQGPTQPPRWLRAFEKVSLAAGESRTINMALPARAFSYWDQPNRQWLVSPGCHEISVGTSSRNRPFTESVAFAGGSCVD